MTSNKKEQYYGYFWHSIRDFVVKCFENQPLAADHVSSMVKSVEVPKDEED